MVTEGGRCIRLHCCRCTSTSRVSACSIWATARLSWVLFALVAVLSAVAF